MIHAQDRTNPVFRGHSGCGAARFVRGGGEQPARPSGALNAQASAVTQTALAGAERFGQRVSVSPELQALFAGAAGYQRKHILVASSHAAGAAAAEADLFRGGDPILMVDALFGVAEAGFPHFFSKSPQPSLVKYAWRFRYYPETDTFIGVPVLLSQNEAEGLYRDGIYVMGGTDRSPDGTRVCVFPEWEALYTGLKVTDFVAPLTKPVEFVVGLANHVDPVIRFSGTSCADMKAEYAVNRTKYQAGYLKLWGLWVHTELNQDGQAWISAFATQEGSQRREVRYNLATNELVDLVHGDVPPSNLPPYMGWLDTDIASATNPGVWGSDAELSFAWVWADRNDQSKVYCTPKTDGKPQGEPRLIFNGELLADYTVVKSLTPFTILR